MVLKAWKLAGHGNLTLMIVLVILLGLPNEGWPLIKGCPSEANRGGDKIVIGSVTKVVGEMSTRLARALLAAFEMRFEKAEAELNEEAMIIYCSNRTVGKSDSYKASVVGILNDEEVLLEVGVHPEGSDIVVTYVVIPIRHYAFFGQPSSTAKGYHQALYEQSQIGTGLSRLFKGNAELRLMAALALALRYEKMAEGESDSERRGAYMNRSRSFYCDAIGSLEEARPRQNFLGLPEGEWSALSNFAHSGVRRLFDRAVGDSDYIGSLSVVASERADLEGDHSACLQ